MTFKNSIISLVSLFVYAGICCGMQNYQYPTTNNNYFSTYHYSTFSLADIMIDRDNSPFAGASAPPMEEHYSYYRPSNSISVQTDGSVRHADKALTFILGITVASAAYLLITYVWHKYNKSFWPYKSYCWPKIEHHVGNSADAMNLQSLAARDAYEGDWLAAN